jgi:predicted ATPase/class 3 adenylate cyclase
MAPSPPTGTVTLLFTDIEGSTKLLDRLGRAYGTLLAEHHDLVRAAIADHEGLEVGTPAGDSFLAAFARPQSAVACAERAQRDLARHTWPDGVEVRVRMGLHTGTPEWDGAAYHGMDVHRAARIMAAAHGGQILASAGTAALLDGVVLHDLGEHRLKDIPSPERLVQVGGGRFPPPRSIGEARLPVPPTSLIGREADVEDCVAAIRGGARLLTLTGPGGTGKTRLALAAATAAAADFADGATFVDLAPVPRADGVAAAIAAAIGDASAQATLEERLAGRRLLLVLDNFEHVLDAAPLVARLLAVAPGVAVLATSRAALRVRGEVVRPVEPLEHAEARELFAARARDAGADADADDPAVGQLCELLDGLPLALELAAARARVLGARGVAERIGSRLDVLAGGPRDAPERQRTLRATIAWSHRLLDGAAQLGFRRLAVFAGGCDLEAAEAVCGAEALDGVEALVDAGMLRRRERPDGTVRFTMLATLRAYALERLEADDDARAVRDRHAAYFGAAAQALDAQVHMLARPRVRHALRRDIDNFRAAHDHLIDTDPDAALELVGAVWPYWEVVGPIAEGRQRLSDSLERSSVQGIARGRALFGAGRLALLHGDADAGEPAVREAAELLRDAGDRRLLALAISHRGLAARLRGETARAFDEEALEIARASGDAWTIAMALNNLADTTAPVAPQTARRLFEESLELRRRSGDLRGELITTVNLIELELLAGDLAAADALAARALREARSMEDSHLLATVLSLQAAVRVLQGRADDARAALDEAAVLHRRVGEARTAALLLAVAGVLVADGDPAVAARCWGSADAVLARLGIGVEALERHLRCHGEPAVVAARGAERVESELEVGRAADAMDALDAALGSSQSNPVRPSDLSLTGFGDD